MLSRVHPVAGVIGLITVLTFWITTVVVELGGSEPAVTAVKQTMPWFLPVLVLALALAGASGFRSAGDSTDPRILAKKRRMPIIAANGLLVLVPSAIALAVLAGRGDIGPVFYAVQTVELLAGAVNIALMSRNIRDGLRLTRRAGARAGEPA